MGVKNLWDILESCKKTLPLHHLQSKRLCVDLSCWLVQLQQANRSLSSAKEKIYLRNLFHRLRALIALNCRIILVADGSIPSIKMSTYRRRLGLNSEVALEEANPKANSLVPLRRNKGSEFSCMIKEAKVLGMALGIPCLDGLEEAEAQCALLNAESLCDGCFTSDSDIFLFGARTVYRDIIIGEGGYVTCYEMVDIEQKLGFGRNSLISLALLLGSDYSSGVNGFGPESACRIVKSLGEGSVLNQIISEVLKFAKKYQGKKNKAGILHTDRNKENEHCSKQAIEAGKQDKVLYDHHLDVINAYLNPNCHSADSEAVRRACLLQPFLIGQLRKICEEYFGWSNDRTDQYILPKIAERDLRRFSDLRSALSMSEVRVSLHEMPAQCPVAAIVKPRKVQGKDCYEVQWQHIEGLQSSIVLSDLVESACPEKIAEFMERRAEGKKKQSRRPRKSSNEALAEVNLQLQSLLLSIEPESSSLPGKVGLQLTDKNSSTTEVIDLSSPSPPHLANKGAKCPNANSQQLDIIDISDSENDVSPEHQKKTSDLRLFLDSIGDVLILD